MFNSRRVQVRVLETIGGTSSPAAVLRRLREFKREYQLNQSDKLWLVIDRDRWEVRNLSAVARETGKLGAGLAVSNPCFELWLYLHFADWIGEAISSRDIENSLRSLLGSYNKSAPPVERLFGKVAEACSRAEQMESNPASRWPENPGSRVYCLVKEINNLIACRGY